MAGNAVLAAYGTSASAVAAGSTASIVSGIAAGAASGATLGAVSVALYGGNLEHVVQSAALGAVGGAIGGGVAGFIGRDMVGRAVGGGLNGFIQTGRLETAGRGMVAGMVAENLWMEAFYTNKVANISIGLARETIRGYIIDEKAGAERGAINYAVMNGTAHAVGHIFFQKNMSFDAKRGIWKYDAGKSIGKFAEALAIGDVVFYDKNTVGSRHSTYQGWLWDHEAAHRDIQSSLGVAYLPTHITSQWIFQEGFQQEAFMERGIWMGGKGYETRPP